VVFRKWRRLICIGFSLDFFYGSIRARFSRFRSLAWFLCRPQVNAKNHELGRPYRSDSD
jgi:hypothetical protein